MSGRRTLKNCVYNKKDLEMRREFNRKPTKLTKYWGYISKLNTTT